MSSVMISRTALSGRLSNSALMLQKKHPPGKTSARK